MELDEQITKAVEILDIGGIIIYPTDTVYGLGADAFNKSAVTHICKIKHRSTTKPISIAILKEWLDDYAVAPSLLEAVIGNYVQNPLTLILKKSNLIPSWITPTEFVGVRIINNEVVEKILTELGRPIVTTSANISGEPPPSSVRNINKNIKEAVDLIIDTGKTQHGVSSTVIKVDETGHVETLRENLNGRRSTKKIPASRGNSKKGKKTGTSHSKTRGKSS